MKSIFIILTLLILASCEGGGPGSSEGSKKTDPVIVESTLSQEELALKNRLVARGFYEQRELAKELAKTKGLNEGTLTKLDAHIEMDCSVDGGCSIYSKE